MTRHILITGGTGYIGTALVRAVLARGDVVTVLSRQSPSPDPRLRWIGWTLTEPVPPAAFADHPGWGPVDAVIHVAHQWDSILPEDQDENLSGTRALLDSCRAAKIARFVFASSISARPGALNRYGRLKWRLTGELNGTTEVAARIGLVYGGPRQGQWGTLCALSGKLPVLPMIGAGQGVQPIHLDDLCEGLVRLAERRDPSRAVWVLADPHPTTFGDWLRLLARHLHGKRLRIVPLPLPLVLLAVRVLNALPLPIKVAEERVLGLAGLEVVDGGSDLDDLGLALRPIEPALAAAGPRRRRRLLAESVTMLRCAAGARARFSPRHLRAYVRGVERYANGRPITLPAGGGCPAMLRAWEPVGGSADPDSLKGRLHMAFTVADTGGHHGMIAYAEQGEGRIRAILRLGTVLLTEACLLPIRALLGRGRK